MSKKQLKTEDIVNELKGSSVFFFKRRQWRTPRTGRT